MLDSLKDPFLAASIGCIIIGYSLAGWLLWRAGL